MGDGARKTILLVEDEAIIALAEKKALELYGYEVLTASSGEKALTALGGTPKINLILMDINLGAGIDGTQTAEIILKDRDIPIIFLSSHSEREVVEKTEKITSYGYVVKNSSITVLDASIKMAFKLFDEKEKSKLVTGKLEATLDALPDVLFEVDLDGLYLHIHSSKSDTLLKPASELVGKKIDEILPIEIAELHLSAIKEAHEKGYSLGMQYPLTVPAGERWFELSVSRMTSQNDDPHFMILRRDITDRMKAEEKYRELLMNLDSGIVVHAPDTSIILNNDRASELLGLSPAQMRGKTAIDPAWHFIDEDNVPLPISEFPVNRILNSLNPIKNQILGVCRPDRNDIVWLIVNGFPIHDDHGAILEILISFMDISERKRTEEALRQNNETLNMILNTVPQSIFWKDGTGRFLGCNRVFASSVGLDDPAKIRGLTDYDLPWPKEEADAYRAADREVIESNTPKWHIIEPLEKFDGTRLVIDTSKTPLRDVNGLPYGILGVYEDITERKKAEEQILGHNRYLQAIIETTVDGFWVVDDQKNILQVNDAYCRMSGYSKEEFRNMHINDLEAEENPDGTGSRIQRIIKNGYEIFETKHRRKDGSVYDVEISTSFLNTNGGQFICFCRDISERKKIEDALHESEERLQFVLKASELGYWDWNFKTTKIQRNERWAEMLGYTKTDIENGLEPWLYLQHPDDRAAAWQSVQDHLEGRTDSYSIKYRLKTKDGNYKWILDSGKIMKRDVDGNPLRLCGTHADINEQVEAELKIRRLLAEKELLLKEVHHRIKNNMATMSSILSLHAANLKDSDASAALNSARMRIKSMEHLYDQLFKSADFSALSIQSYLPSLIDEIVANFPERCVVTVEKHIGEFFMDARRMQVLGILINELITNIMKYAFRERTRGLITVSAIATEGTVLVGISDDGNGIPESVDFNNSTGFGLQLVQALSTQLEGTIRIERGSGTDEGAKTGTKVVLEFAM